MHAHTYAQAATERKDEAILEFEKELREVDFEDGEDDVLINLLQPKQHLVAAMYTEFRKHVMNAGCKVKRRVLTADEKLEHKIPRKGPVYFVDVLITREAQQTALAKSAQKTASSSKARAQSA